jgi:hypothetical protein
MSGKTRISTNIAILITTVAIVAVFVFINMVSEAEKLTAIGNGGKLGFIGGQQKARSSGASSKEANDLCSNVCTQRRQKRTGGVNLLDHRELVEEVSKAKDRLIDKLKIDYGDYFEPIFVDEETGRYRPFEPVTEASMERLKRKLMIKVLSMQSSLSLKDSNFHGCNCSGGKDQALRNNVLESLDPDDASAVFEGLYDDATGVFEKYVWATGGHSASAGHGNLFNETYTSYMESDLKDVFASIGIEFEGRNYAMGGTASATIISMCWEEVFGTDVDFFSWDYGMTDGNDVARLLHYTYRGALSQSRPAMMLIRYDGRSGPKRLGAVKPLEEIGLAAFHGSQKPEQAMKDEFPDSAGLSTEELDAMPEYVRNYKCGTSIEKGDPFCGTEKYTKWGCPKRMKQASWHPGL